MGARLAIGFFFFVAAGCTPSDTSLQPPQKVGALVAVQTAQGLQIVLRGTAPLLAIAASVDVGGGGTLGTPILGESIGTRNLFSHKLGSQRVRFAISDTRARLIPHQATLVWIPSSHAPAHVTISEISAASVSAAEVTVDGFDGTPEASL
jgi:hypothetical protein